MTRPKGGYLQGNLAMAVYETAEMRKQHVKDCLGGASIADIDSAEREGIQLDLDELARIDQSLDTPIQDNKENKTMPRLKDYGTIDGLAKRLDDIAGQEVVIHEVEFRTGNFGKYAVLKLTDENGEVQTVMTGGYLVVDALEDAVEQEALPVEAVFTKSGRTWGFE